LLQSQYYGSDIAMHNIKKIDLNLLVVLDARWMSATSREQPRGWATHSQRLAAC
jgi:hypothetical protein